MRLHPFAQATQAVLRTLSLTTLAGAAVLAACGGGGGGDASTSGGIGSGGTGNSPSSGVASGTVGGFGSIFVGGVRCDDTRAKLAINTAAGTAETGTPDVKLGQSVLITFDPASSSCKVLQALVDPEIVGVISSLSPLTVAGQRVLVNTDATVAPPTVLDGYADSSGLKLGDRVEVHGKAVTSAGTAAVLASRIERKPASDTWVRAKGVVAGLTATQFTIGNLTVKRDSTTRLDPASLTLANGQTLVVWSNAAVAGDGSVTASVIRLANLALEDRQDVRIEGPVAGCTAAPCSQPVIDGLAVDLSAATFVNGTLADVANGVAMRGEGRYDAAHSRLVASKASVRLRDASAADVTLIGMVSDFVSASDFSVRGVPVTTNGSTTLATGCTVAPGTIVAITGTASGAQVLARSVSCPALSDGITLDVFGALVNVDTTARTFTLSEGAYAGYTLSWDADTVFGSGLAGATLTSGLRVGLRAVVVDLVGRKLLVKRLIADPVPVGPGGVQLFGNFGLARDVTAGSLTVGRIQMAIVPGTTNIDSGIVDGTPVRTWFYRSGLSWVALKVAKVSWN